MPSISTPTVAPPTIPSLGHDAGPGPALEGGAALPQRRDVERDRDRRAIQSDRLVRQQAPRSSTWMSAAPSVASRKAARTAAAGPPGRAGRRPARRGPDRSARPRPAPLAGAGASAPGTRMRSSCAAPRTRPRGGPTRKHPRRPARPAGRGAAEVGGDRLGFSGARARRARRPAARAAGRGRAATGRWPPPRVARARPTDGVADERSAEGRRSRSPARASVVQVASRRASAAPSSGRTAVGQPDLPRCRSSISTIRRHAG